MDTGVIGILIAHLGAFGSGELKRTEEEIVINTIRYTMSHSVTWLHSSSKT